MMNGRAAQYSPLARSCDSEKDGEQEYEAEQITKYCFSMLPSRGSVRDQGLIDYRYLSLLKSKLVDTSGWLGGLWPRRSYPHNIIGPEAVVLYVQTEYSTEYGAYEYKPAQAI